ncbi:MAG: hypothetical protein J6Y08_04430 [Clostridiales bacterium]|nr:hypothetical protein [Clostridiales bacterium]
MKFLQTSKRHLNSNKRGGMLVLVLIIFAVALILISSAISITVSTRNRYYVDAETSQERLTLSCAAEAVIDAIEAQEITDAELEHAAAGSGTTWHVQGATNSNMDQSGVASDGLNIAPGLAGQSYSYTDCHVHAVGGTSKDIYLDFSTKIKATGGTATSENLRVRLEYTPPSGDPPICTNLTTTGEDGVTNNSPKMFVQDPRSFTVFHGEAYIAATSGSFIHNTAVFTGELIGNAGTIFYNDVIFYGPNAGLDVARSGGNGLTIEAVGDWQGSAYFLGVTYEEATGQQYAFHNQGSEVSLSDKNLNVYACYFYNARGQITSWPYDGADKMIISDNGSNVQINRGWTGSTNIVTVGTGTGSGDNTVASSALTDAALVEKFASVYATGTGYVASGAEVVTAAGRQVPTSADMAAYNTHPGTSSVPHGTTSISRGAYNMTGAYSAGVLTCDLSSGDIYINVSGTCTFTDYYIYAPNTSDYKLYVILQSGASLIFNNCDNTCKDTLRTCGIVACSNPERTNWHDAEFVQQYDSTGHFVSSSPLRATPGQKPACYILGMGNNYLEGGRACTIEGYICLGGRGTQASKLCIKDNCNFYGRYESVFMDQGNSDNLEIYYCPSPQEGDDSDKPLTSSYTPVDYQYYY